MYRCTYDLSLFIDESILDDDIPELHLDAMKFVPKHKLKGSVFVHLYNMAFSQKQSVI